MHNCLEKFSAFYFNEETSLQKSESYIFWFVYTYTLVGLLLGFVHPQQKAHDIGCAKSISFRAPMLLI